MQAIVSFVISTITPLGVVEFLQSGDYFPQFIPTDDIEQKPKEKLFKILGIDPKIRVGLDFFLVGVYNQPGDEIKAEIVYGISLPEKIKVDSYFEWIPINKILLNDRISRILYDFSHVKTQVVDMTVKYIN